MKHIAALGGVMIAAAIVAGFAAQVWNVPAAWTASFLAAALIWAVESAAIVLVARAPLGPARVTATMLGMLLRMLVALGAALVVSRGGLTVAGVDVGRSLAGMIAVHYLVGLCFGTWMCVRLVGAAVKPQSLPATSIVSQRRSPR